MKEPLISVIVPVYKVEAYLERCVNSIRGQTYRNLEIILVDDGSPDRCGEMCDQLAADDPRIRVLHKENGGLSSARNWGLDAATGEYVSFIDSDDYIKPDMYEYLYSLLESYGAQIACGGIERVNDEGHISYFNDSMNDLLVLSRSQALRELVENYRVTSSACDKLFRREIFRERRMTEGILFEDYDIMHECLFDAERIVYSGKVVYCYYQSPDSIIRKDYNPRRFDEMAAERKRLRFYEKNSPENLDVEAPRYVRTGVTILVQSKGARGCRALRTGLRRELLDFVRENPQLQLHPSIARKMRVLKFCLPAFDLALDIAALKRKLVRR